MTKNDFIHGYCKRSHITEEIFHKYQVALPCNCGDEGCEGWAAIRLDAQFIEDHLTFQAPDDIRKYYED